MVGRRRRRRRVWMDRAGGRKNLERKKREKKERETGRDEGQGHYVRNVRVQRGEEGDGRRRGYGSQINVRTGLSR